MEERRLLLAIVLSVAILFGWQFLFPPQKPEPKKIAESHKVESPGSTAEIKIASMQNATDEKNAGKPQAERTVNPSDIASVNKAEAQTVEIETGLYNCSISTEGGGIEKFELKKYRQTVKPDSKPIVMVDPAIDGKNRPLNMKIGFDDKWLPADSGYMPDKNSLDLTEKAAPETATLTMSMKTNAGIEIERKYTFHRDSYRIDVAVEVSEFSLSTFESVFAGNLNVSPILLWNHLIDPVKTKNRFAFYGIVAKSKDQKYEEKRVPDIQKKGPFAYQDVTWAGFAEDYFLSVVISKDNNTAFKSGIEKQQEIDLSVGEFDFPQAQLTSKKPVKIEFSVFIGPKDNDLLAPFGVQLEDAVGYGRFKIIVLPLIWILKQSHRYVHNWGLAIILLTLIVKIIFYPLTKKSFESMKSMQALQPRIKEMQEKFKDDREKLNTELMALYRTHKVNPVGGCLPMLLQFPVLYALYRALYVSIELRHSPFVWWIKDLSSPESIFVIPLMGGIHVGFMPFLMGASMYVQQKMSPTTVTDPLQANMFMAMPVIFTFMSFGFPSGLVLYWFVSNLLSIIQQYVINRRGI